MIVYVSHVIDRDSQIKIDPGKGIIHIVYDEPDIVSVAISIEREGYAVHSFTNPLEALEDIELRCRKK
ncbi:hypothetical protein Ngar_c28710 [Candidatus Nitrososphaera gargensis Ga9.2]|uniref:Uncharacterized protein n=1 Tax=Nitrososphaera gargensis (strain Ga9.2) TaxID=1237085 RepID=K0IIN9_NITGG|nr:hypothetical protein Ngar_c28710 [Candidatus Nitrososphaera gargensis Ga9.2]